jgi:anti-anti-sigma regulatory factor
MSEGSEGRLIVSLRGASRTAASLVFGLGVVVLVGWGLEIKALTSVVPNQVTMKANTALGFALCGVALRWSTGERAGTRAGYVARVCAGAVALLGLLTLIEYVFGWNLGIDELLFRDTSAGIKTSSPGRMGSNTALTFLLLGGALLLQKRPRWIVAAQLLSLAAGVVTLVALTGYVYGAESLYGLGSHTRMAVHTAVGFVVLCAGLVMTHPDRGVLAIVTSERAGGALARGVFPAVIGVPLLLGLLLKVGRRAELYDSGLEVALFAVASVVTFASLTLVASRSLTRAEIQALEIEAALRGRLEDRIAAEEAARSEAQRLSKSEAEGRQHLSRAVSDYLAFVERVAKGDLAQRIAAKHDGTLGRLGEGLNQMVGSLEASFTAEQRAQAEARRLQEEVIRIQDATLAELSTPLIPMGDGVVVMPLVGAVDSQRAQRVLRTLLQGVSTHRARAAILDVTGVPVVDSQVANGLVLAAQAVRLLGAQVVLTGIRPEVAEALVNLGADLTSLVTRGSLGEGINFAARPRPRAASARAAQ